MYKSFLAFCVAVFAFAGVAMAASSSKPKMVGYGAQFKLTTRAYSGACPDGYANQCPSGDYCSCFVSTGKGAGSRLGKAAPGNVTVEMTVDFDNAPDYPDGGCYPIYGFIDAVGKKEEELIDFMGATCQTDTQEGLKGVTYVGGWGFDEPSTNVYDAFGQLKGRVVSTNGSINGLNLSLHGKACVEPGADQITAVPCFAPTPTP